MVRRSIVAGAAAAVGLLATAGAGAAQWVEAPGTGWYDVAVYHQDTRRAFEFDGEERNFFAGGHAVGTSVFLTVAGGLLPGVDAWVQLPFQRLRFDDAAGDRLRQGIGDTRVYLRVRPLDYLGLDVPFALRGGVKVPVGDFAVDSEVIPLGDGQTDWEVMAELGHSFYPVSAYLNGWLGYRWRSPDAVSRRDFGDELFYLVQAGGEAGPLTGQVVLEGFESVTTPIIEGIALPNAERALVQITPRLGYGIGPGTASVGVRFALSGRNLPAGTSFVLGYFGRWAIGS